MSVKSLRPLILSLFLPFLVAPTLMAQDLSDFQRGVEMSQKGQGKEALSLFQEVLKKDPQNPSVLTNAGIAAAQSEQWGLSISYLRDAAHLDPGLLQTQKAIEFVQTRLPIKEIPHRVELWESYRQEYLGGISLIPLLLLGALLLLLVGLLFLRWMNERKKALDNDEPLPRLRLIHVVAAVLLVLQIALSLSKFYEIQEVRATILPEKVAIHSAPDTEAPSLFDLYAGLEVRVLRRQGDWLQIQYPGGPTGWINQSALRISALSSFDNGHAN